MSKLAQTIPVLDLRAFVDGSPADRDAFVAALGSALEVHGFFALEHHGVPREAIAAGYAAAARFFELPEAAKRRYEDPAGRGQRGFTCFGREHAKDHPVGDLKEFWHAGRGANLAPVEAPALAPALDALYAALEASAMHVLDACSRYLGLPAGALRGDAEGGDSILRVIHYPPVPADAHPAALRSAPHEDINLVTLLCESTDEGLELLRRDGSWQPIHALEGQIVVDSGDMLQNLTNGLFRSTTHRVVNPPDARARRFSMPFFVHPRAEVSLAPRAPCLARTGGATRYPAITAGAYLSRRLEEIGLGARA